MRDLYYAIDKWQMKGGKQIISISICRDDKMFCAIAVTVPA
jgi:hypothetical protein